MYNDKLVYKIVIWFCLGVILWKEKEALSMNPLLWSGEMLCC